MRFIIRAVKERVGFIEYLQKHLPQAEWCYDRNRNAMDTFLEAMRMAGNDPVVHMEEDIVLTKNFVPKIEAAIAERPNEVIQFFSMRKDDLLKGSRYDRNYLMNQCFYLPAGYSLAIHDYYQFWDDKEKHPTGTDNMICDYLRAGKEKYWIHVPSLVDHRVAVSMIDSRRSSKRQSLTFKDPV